MRLDLFLRGLWGINQQPLHLHRESRGAHAALAGTVVHHSLLHWIQAGGGAADTLNSGDVHTVKRGDGSKTRVNTDRLYPGLGSTVDAGEEHGADTAPTLVAHSLRPLETRGRPQVVVERHPRIRIFQHHLAIIHVERYRGRVFFRPVHHGPSCRGPARRLHRGHRAAHQLLLQALGARPHYLRGHRLPCRGRRHRARAPIGGAPRDVNRRRYRGLHVGVGRNRYVYIHERKTGRKRG
mmetsp:Transcript_1498/g.4050  ORF Transcript_1498/g.4050 Transcript_1498/m.4050 type:complete len:238 (+) Transcript_1498:3572-4285(+)